MAGQAQILPGTLDLLILKAVSRPALRVRHSSAHRTDLARGATHRTGCALSSFVSLGPPGTPQDKLGHIR